MLQDLRYAARVLRKSPGFTTIAALTLALGIGANTAVFSIVDAVLLRPLPYRNPERLAVIWDQLAREKGFGKVFDSYADFEEWRRHARGFENVAVETWAVGGRVLTGHGPAKEVLALPVSASFFSLLGIAPALGRTFEEERGCSVVLTDRFWRNTLGADRGAIGRHLTLDRDACVVLGVMPPGFAFYPEATEMWILLGPDFRPKREDIPVGVFARLKPGVTIEQAQAEVSALHAALHRSDGREKDIAPVVYKLQSEFTWLAARTLRSTLWVLAAAVGFVLLIACLNVANLLLGRSLTRERELAVRAALGSGQGRLVRQLLTEGLLLAAIGCVPGMALAFAAIRYFRFANPVELPIGADVAMNAPVLLFACTLSAATTLIFALLPAWRASRVDVNHALKAASRSAIYGGSRQRMVRAMVIAEMALSVVLLTGAGLLMESVLRMQSDAGFDPRRLITARITLPEDRYFDAEHRARFHEELLRRLNRLPAVSGASLSSELPPYGSGAASLEIQGRPAAMAVHDVETQAVSPEYFRVLGIPLLRGRAFDTRDRMDSEPVAVVNEALVREYFAGRDPIGQHVRLEKQPWVTIVGVARNEKHMNLYHEMGWAQLPALIRPLAQDARRSVSIAVRGGELQEIQRAIGAIDGNVPASDSGTMEARLGKTLAYPRFRAVLSAAFAILALLLAAVGLHGVLAQFVAQRMPEFGLRMAVGAQTGDLFRLVAWQGGIPVLAGMALGLFSGFALTRSLSSILYGIKPGDPFTTVIVLLALLGAAGIAIARPAWRAARADPMAALRDE